MKKWLLIPLVLVMLYMLGAASLTTRISSYRVLHTITDIDTPDTELAAATGFFIGVPSGAVDLLIKAGAGYDTYANTVSLIVNETWGANGDTATQKLYGIAEGGPPQLIASIVWKFGLAQVDATATNLWAETATVTSSHVTTITVCGADGDDKVGSVTFDVAGFRYLYGLWTADSGDPNTVTCYYRYF